MILWIAEPVRQYQDKKIGRPAASQQNQNNIFVC
jgi:hypothetical protein